MKAGKFKGKCRGMTWIYVSPMIATRDARKARKYLYRTDDRICSGCDLRSWDCQRLRPYFEMVSLAAGLLLHKTFPNLLLEATHSIDRLSEISIQNSDDRYSRGLGA
jgi:hypothetical protein